MAALFQRWKAAQKQAQSAPGQTRRTPEQTQPATEQTQPVQETIVCPACGREINKKEAEKNLYACYECGSYFRVRTKNRIRMLADNGTFEPWFEDIPEVNPLDFPGYEEKVGAAKEKTGLHEAVTVGRCQIYGEETVLGICVHVFL